MNPEYGADLPIALALSGGGFRATLFHLGVVRYLRATNQLKRVTSIASVSGGSVLAAHLVTNWSRYTGSVEHFHEAANELLSFTARDVRGRIVRRLPWLMLRRFLPKSIPLPRTTTDLLIRELRKFYGDVNFADIPKLESEAPRLSLIATNLTYPGITTFEYNQVSTYLMSDGKQSRGFNKEPITHEGTSIPLHLAVACSPAYPAFFPPVPISQEDLAAGADYGIQYHTDGGVVDNQGLQTLLSANESADTTIIISDASSPMVYAQPVARFGLLTSGMRSMELMMAYIRRTHYASFSKKSKDSVVLVNIEPEEEDLQRDHWGPVCSQLPHIRTDLDEFDRVERTELVRHGFFSAQAALKLAVTNRSLKLPEKSTLLPASIARHLRSRVAFKSRFFAIRDYVTIINVLIILSILGFIGWNIPFLISSTPKLWAVFSSRDLRSKPLGMIGHSSPIDIKEIDSIGPPPTNPGFMVTAEDRVWDLRTLRLSEKRDAIVGPAYMTRYTEVQRRDSTATEYTYRFETSGYIDAAWSGEGQPGLSFRVFREKPGDPNLPSGPSTLRAYKCVVDCSRAPIGTPFLIVVQARYVDAFKNRKDWWTGMIVSDDSRRVAMRIVFPPALPFQHPTFRRYPIGSRLDSETFEGTAIKFPGDSPELMWTVSPPVPGSTYRVDWDWYPDSQ